MKMSQTFLQDSIKRFEYYKSLADKSFEQLEEKDFFFKASPESNSIAVIIQHMYGNMLSRWTNFLTEDGEKEWRKRDAEFEDTPISKQDLLSFWEAGWNCLMSALLTLTADDLTRTVHIRNEPLLVYDAILRQLAHYPYHVGQIVFIAKMIRDKEFTNLSMPKRTAINGNQQTQQQN